jgi:hypothetical protein
VSESAYLGGLENEQVVFLNARGADGGHGGAGGQGMCWFADGISA